MTIMFADEINDRSIINLINQIEVSDAEHITIYFSTEGGIFADMLVLIDYINDYPDRFTLIFFKCMSSCGISLVTKAKCKKLIIPHCYSAIHIPTMELCKRELQNPNSIDSFLDKNVLAKDHDIYISHLKDFGITTDKSKNRSAYLKQLETLRS